MTECANCARLQKRVADLEEQLGEQEFQAEAAAARLQGQLREEKGRTRAAIDEMQSSEFARELALRDLKRAQDSGDERAAAVATERLKRGW